MKIAVDGPSGSGKSTISKLFAKKHNLQYIDTGAMYRALTYYFLNKNIKKEEDVVKELQNIDILLDGSKVILNGVTLGHELRTSEIDKNVSYYSTLSKLRKWLVEKQRAISDTKDSIMDGRDIGTVVLKNADYKFFITADVDVRAKRRYEQNKNLDYDNVLKDIIKRDEMDSTRSDSPLRKADDAILIDSSELNIEEVIERMERVVFHDCKSDKSNT